jgi:release factor glutamine methyltransferase
LLSILAAKAGARVVATDINPVALECARDNAVEHGVAGSIDFRLGDLFGPVRGESFDLLVFNPPYLPSEDGERSSDPVELAWDGGKDGRKVLDRFLREFPHHLKPEGRAFFVQSSLSNVFQTKQMLEANNFKFKALEKKLFFERLYLFICFRS